MKRVYDRVSGVQDVPSYYRPRRWRVRSRLKFLITRPRLREWADRHDLIVGVVNVRVGEMTEEHAHEISRALFIGDREIEGVHAFAAVIRTSSAMGIVTPLFRKLSE
jgi:hypothetical protein